MLSSVSLSNNVSGDPGWCGPQCDWSETDPGPRLAALPLPKLCPVGFVFIWAEKEHISSVIKQVMLLLTCCTELLVHV